MNQMMQHDSINGDNIRKAWHNGEWVYSVIDMIAELLGKKRQDASNYWRQLKSTLIAEGNKSITKCQQLKMRADDKKMRLTDTANLETSNELIEIIQRVSFNRAKRARREADEVINLHPLIILQLENEGWLVNHHLDLPSGKTIDMVANRGSETIIVECKRSLLGTQLFQAIGQVLCYADEYGNPAQPVIACLSGQVNDYAYQRCQALGIDILEVEMRAISQQARAFSD